MKSIDTIINNLKSTMNAEPDDSLKERILKNATAGSSVIYMPKRRNKTTRTLLIAAVLVVLTITTAFATGLPGYIRSRDAGNLTINEYQRGYLPNADPADIDRFGMLTIGDLTVEDYTQVLTLESLEEARDTLDTPLLIPAHLENNEVPVDVRLFETSAGTRVVTLYMDAYRDEDGDLKLNDWNNQSFFNLGQIYVGDEKVIFDIVDGFTDVKVNGHDAVWIGGYNGTLSWIQDGIYLQLQPYRLDWEYVLKIAESLVFLP